MVGFVYEITPRCNLNCGFCYNVWKESGELPGELGYHRISELLEKVLPEAGPQWLTFAGGEPLLHPDLVRSVRFAKTRFPHIRLGIATNGALLEGDICRELVEAGIEHFEISLFASDKETYRRMAGASALASVHRAITYVKREGAALTVATVLTAQNMGELEAVMETAFALGADRLALNRFVPTGKGKGNRQTFHISTSELDRALRLADGKSAKLGLPVTIAVPVEDCVLAHKEYPCLNFSACACGQVKWAIDPLGRMRICEQSAHVLGDLFHQRFSDLAACKSVQFFRQAGRSEFCPECRHYGHCGGGCRFAEKGEPFLPTGS
ncbi:MAG: radical SAM protein [Pseudomonadota bacterium]